MDPKIYTFPTIQFSFVKLDVSHQVKYCYVPQDGQLNEKYY